MAEHTEIVNASLSKVWEHFLYKIDHPENFVPGVSNVEVLERTSTHVIRAMDLTSPNGSTTRILEKITHSPHWVKFLILEHPLYEGYVENLAEALSDFETRITFSVHWTNKSTGEPFNGQDIVKSAVRKTAAFILDHSE